MKRISYWILSTLSAVVLLVGFDASRHGAALSTTTGSSFASGTTASGGSSTSSSSSSSAAAGTTNGKKHSKKSTKTTTTTATGAVAQTQWGPVQVQLAVTGGSISRVKVLQFPTGNPRDVQLADYALPILIKETTQSQSANIDMVSGATYTSTGYIQSLQSALDQAHL
jgi:uncharacterized protein with FMN-binding domain